MIEDRGRTLLRNIPLGNKAALIALILLCHAGCKEETSPGKGTAPSYDLGLPQPDPEGPRYEDVDFSLDVGTPERCEPNGILAPQSGRVRLAIPVHIQVKGSRDVPFGPMLFSLSTDDTVLRPTLASCKPAFNLATLSQGDERTRYVAFDLPAGQSDLELAYEPFLIGRKQVLARVLVPRVP